MSSFTFAFLLVAQSGEGTRSDWADDMARVVQAFRERGATTEDPWLLSHACLALGDSFALPSGTEAVDHLIATFGVHEATTGERGWGFPPPVDPHTCSFISELARGPIDFDVVVEPIQAMRRCFLQACFLAVQWEDLRPEVERVWPLAVAVAVAGTEWVPPPPRMDAYVSAAIEAYERRSRSYHAAYAENRDRHPLSFQHIPCNGRHLLFAFVCAAFAGEPDRERQATVVRLLGKERDRLASELTRVAHSADKPAFLHHAESIGLLGHHLELRGQAYRLTGDARWRREGLEAAPRFFDLVHKAREEERWREIAAERRALTEAFGGMCHGYAGLRLLHEGCAS